MAVEDTRGDCTWCAFEHGTFEHGTPWCAFEHGTPRVIDVTQQTVSDTVFTVSETFLETLHTVLCSPTSAFALGRLSNAYLNVPTHQHQNMRQLLQKI